MVHRPASLLTLAGALAVAACIAVDNDSGGTWIRYSCSDGRMIDARYDNSDAVNPRAELVIARRRIAFDAARAGSGARYVASNGLRGGHGLVWWTRGREATLFDFPLETGPGGGRERPIASCAAA